MKYVIYQTTSKTVTGYQLRKVLDMHGWSVYGEVITEIASFEAETSDEAREKFDAWDDAQPRPEERCEVCDALRAEGHTIPLADTSSSMMSSTAELVTGPLSSS